MGDRGRLAGAIDAASSVAASWAGLAPRDRADVLQGAAELLRTRTDQMATVLSAETGKLPSGATAELELSVAYLRWFSDRRRADARTAKS